MSSLRYIVPIFSVVGFGGAAYLVFTGTLKAEKMGVSKNVLRMFGAGELLMAICWAVIPLGLRAGAVWPRYLAFLITGMYLCNYLISLAMFKNMGDKLFKYWGTASAVILPLYCIWI
ncbi:hypothetical protein HZA56_19620 [Candidatus Poribacteria bacterium]|nr:hypothetical protein [Candidatus Poribacteria bacterium]